MQRIFLLTVGLLALAGSVASAQSTLAEQRRAQYGGKRIVGLNMTPLVTQFVPFNRTDPRDAGPFLVRFKKYGPDGRRAFRFSMGLHLSVDDEGNTDDLQFNFALGWERQRSISKRWSYTRGFDFMLLTGDLNVPGNATTEDPVPMLGLGPLWGMEFAIDRNITLGVEAVLALGFAPGFEDGIRFEIIPPVGLFLNHYF